MDEKFESQEVASNREPGSSTKLTPEIIQEFLKLYNEARAEHFKAKSLSRFDSPAHVAAIAFAQQYGIPGQPLLEAIVLSRTGQSEKAWALVNKCPIGLPNVLLGQWHHVCGFVLVNLRKYDEAIAQYQKALETPGYDKPSNTLNNLGNAYSHKGEYDRAIEQYTKALDDPTYDTPHLARSNLARVLWRAGLHAKALEQLKIILSEPDRENRHDIANYLQSMIESELAEAPASPSDRALSEETPQSRPDIDQIDRMKDKLRDKEDKYGSYLKRYERQTSTPEEATIGTFHCLRGWSSAVTLLEGSDEHQWRGGGYFFRWADKGIVVDPGLDFIDNFHDADFHAMQIDAVLVSHNHADHNYDLRALDDLLYEIYGRANKNPTDKHGPKSKTEFIIDVDTEKGFPEQTTGHRDFPLTFSKATHARKKWFDLKESGIDLKVEHFPVQHGSDVPNAVGMRLRFLPPNLPEFLFGYTGDTRYFKGLSEHFKQCHVLLAHMSQPDGEEFQDENFLKKVHLGYNGVAKLIQETDAKLYLIGEFWAGLSDLRVDLIQGLRQRTGKKNILPTGIGFTLDLPSLEVRCSECNRKTPFELIRITPSTTSFGALGYLCERCFI